MLRPSPEEVLKSISWTFDNHIRPKPTDPLSISYALTVSNMLRHLHLCMTREEGLIEADTVDLRAMLEQAQTFLAGIGGVRAAAKRIGEALAVVPPATAQGKRDNWRELRWTLETAIKTLRALRPSFVDDTEYRNVRQAIRDYLDRSLDREAKLIDGAFTVARR